jgi:nucleotide-binding universal stress UspA family protein
MTTVTQRARSATQTVLPTKLLIPVDGSENSERASNFALELSNKLGTSVVFLHVMEIPISAYKYRRIAESVLELLEESGRKVLANCEEEARKKGVSCEVVLSNGDPSDQILITARKRKCDCIIMGKRGLGRIERMLMGSVSDQVTRLSDIPVIIVK